MALTEDIDQGCLKPDTATGKLRRCQKFFECQANRLSCNNSLKLLQEALQQN